MAFQQKRKTLLNTLSRRLGREKSEMTDALSRIGIDGGSRPQALSFDEWIRLATADLSEP
jgi:16S rRNA A1518/A1519 N6-dimethyltransferase RsmA/KsgA/DIM1 with predicted DNA glycosylase/AP lyase activity